MEEVLGEVLCVIDTATLGLRRPRGASNKGTPRGGTGWR